MVHCLRRLIEFAGIECAMSRSKEHLNLNMNVLDAAKWYRRHIARNRRSERSVRRRAAGEKFLERATRLARA